MSVSVHVSLSPENQFLRVFAMRKFFLILLISGSWTWCHVAAAQSPSFDCSKARYPDELAICRTPDLAELDNVIAGGLRVSQSHPRKVAR